MDVISGSETHKLCMEMWNFHLLAHGRLKLVTLSSFQNRTRNHTVYAWVTTISNFEWHFGLIQWMGWLCSRNSRFSVYSFLQYCECFFLPLFVCTLSNTQTLHWMGNSSFILSLFYSTKQCNNWVLHDFRESICRIVLKSKKFFCIQFIFIELECPGYAQIVNHLGVLYGLDAKLETTFAQHFRGGSYWQFLPASTRTETLNF